MSEALADRVAALRDEVLDSTEQSGDVAPGGELFDAIIRALDSGTWSPQGDSKLQEAISQRLAWGESERTVLADLNGVVRKLVSTARRRLSNPREQNIVGQIASHVSCAAARLVAVAVLGRAARERAGLIREELARTRLQHALDRQREELAKLNDETA